MIRRKPYSYRDDPAVPDFADDGPIMVFDGECGFCSGWVRFFLKHDAKKNLRFASAQSALGTALLIHYGHAGDDYETSILMDEGKAYFKSEGAIRTLATLGFPWMLTRIFMILPEGLRDRFYDIIARNRMRIAGRRETCFLPSAEHRVRFLA